MTQSTAGLGLSSSGLLPSELMELQARQLRMQELGLGRGIGSVGGGPGLMGQLPHGFHRSPSDGPEAVMVRNLREDSKQETKQVDSQHRRKKAKR